MGEIADAMINGESCSYCGMIFIDSKNKEEQTFESFKHGYPVLCMECYDTAFNELVNSLEFTLTSQEKQTLRKLYDEDPSNGLQRAIKSTL